VIDMVNSNINKNDLKSQWKYLCFCEKSPPGMLLSLGLTDRIVFLYIFELHLL